MIRRSLSRVAGIAWIAGISLNPAAASASLVVALDLPTMVERADNVVVADVVSVRSDWDGRHEKIVTTIELSVVETWKGTAAPSSRIKVVQPGGTVGEDTLVVHGMSRFTPGERSVLFLRGAADRSGVVGMAQGKRLVRRAVDDGPLTSRLRDRWLVHAPDRAGAVFVKTRSASGRTPVIEMRAQPIEDLRAEVQALVNARPSQGK